MTKKNTIKLYSEWLVLRCQDKDADAFSELYTLWNGIFTRHVAKLSGSADQTPDIVQDGWIAISRGIKKIKNPAMFSAWGYRIMTNKVRDWQRKNIPKDNLRASASESELEKIAAKPQDTNRDDIDVVRLALDKLSATQKEIIDYYYFKEMKIHEIAELMGLATGTIKSRLYTARQQLKIIMERMDHD